MFVPGENQTKLNVFHWNKIIALQKIRATMQAKQLCIGNVILNRALYFTKANTIKLIVGRVSLTKQVSV